MAGIRGAQISIIYAMYRSVSCPNIRSLVTCMRGPLVCPLGGLGGQGVISAKFV